MNPNPNHFAHTSQNKRLVEELERLRKENEELNKHFHWLRDRISVLINERDTAHEQLAARTAELRATERFLTTADSASDMDVCRIVDKLNAEIFQAAATIADAFHGRLLSINTAPTADAEGVRELLDVGISRALRKRPTTDRVIQFALQALMATICVDLAMRCDAMSTSARDSPINRFLHDTWQRLQMAEPQAVANRWRSLLFRYAAPSVHASPERLLAQLVARIADVLRTAGVPGDLHAALTARHCARLGRVVDAALALRTVTSEGALAFDYVPTVVRGGRWFNAATMTDVSAYSGARRNKVLCTTRIGLDRREKLSDNGATWDEVQLLQPEVVLTRSLKELEDDGEESGEDL